MSSQRGKTRMNDSHQDEEPVPPHTEPGASTDTICQPNRELENLDDVIYPKAPKKPRSSCTSYQSAEDYKDKMAAKTLMAMPNCDVSFAEFAPDRYIAEGTVLVAKEFGYFIIKVSSKTATHHFDTQAMDDQLLLFSDKNDNGWSLKLSFFDSKGVEVNDIVRFYHPVERFHRMHFLVECFPYLGEKKLTATDVTIPQLHIYSTQIEHFYSTHIKHFIKHFYHEKKDEPRVVSKRSIQVFDYENKSWGMELVYYHNPSTLKITGSWKDFVGRHNLTANDTIRFYKASTDGSCYLIRF